MPTEMTPTMRPLPFVDLEKRGLIKGRWIEKAGQRRRRYYRITAQGRTVLASQRSTWENFILALSNVTRLRQT